MTGLLLFRLNNAPFVKCSAPTGAFSMIDMVFQIAGFSDPYCMLGIMPLRRLEGEEGNERTSLGSSDEENSSPKERDRKGRGFRFSMKKKEKSGAVRDLLPAKYIQTTSVKPNTLNPEWNERFRL